MLPWPGGGRVADSQCPSRSPSAEDIRYNPIRGKVAAAEVAAPVVADTPRASKRKDTTEAPKTSKPVKPAGGPELDLFG